MDNAISRSTIAEVLRGKSIDTEPDVEYVADELYKRLKHFDAVPVVRCKDCKRFIPYTEAYRKASSYDGDCAFLAGYTDCERECVHDMDFCSKGEKMDKKEDTK